MNSNYLEILKSQAAHHFGIFLNHDTYQGYCPIKIFITNRVKNTTIVFHKFITRYQCHLNNILCLHSGVHYTTLDHYAKTLTYNDDDDGMR